MTEFSFWVNYYFNTKKWHTSTLNQNVKLDWNILSVVCRHHDWQLWCKGIISFPFFLQEHKTYLGFLVAAGMWATVLFLCFLSVSPQALIFAMFFIFICLFPSCSLRTIPVGQHVCCGLTLLLRLLFFLARSGKSCFRSPPGGIKFSRIPSCHKRFCVLLKLNEVQVCWERISPEMEGGWWLFKVYVFFPLLAWKLFFPFQTLDLCLGQNHVAIRVIPAEFRHLSLDQNAQVVLLYHAFPLNVVLAPRHLGYNLIQACPDWWWTTQGCAEWDIAGSMGDLLGKFPGLVNSQIPLKSMFWFEVGERQAVSQT